MESYITMKINDLRLMIDEIDIELLKLIIKRIKLSKKIGILKKQNGLKIVDKKREVQVLTGLTNKAKRDKIDKHSVEKIWKELFKLSYKMEQKKDAK